jgi:hypothetical protein
MPSYGYQIPQDAMISEEGPQNMGSPLTALLKAMGIGSNNRDINLPAQGPTDPRLNNGGLNVQVDEMLKSGTTALNPLQGLKKAFGR